MNGYDNVRNAKGFTLAAAAVAAIDPLGGAGIIVRRDGPGL